jgi:hypothetical protein
MPIFNNNLVLGRGRLFFSRFATGTTTFTGAMKYFGNTPAVSLNVTEEVLEHFDSDQGLRIKDRVVTLSQEIAGSFQVDNISNENLKLFFGADDVQTTHAVVTGAVESITSAETDAYFQLGVTAGRPQGYRGLTTVTSVTEGATTLTANTDYEVDLVNGRIWLPSGSTAFDAGDTLVVTYTVGAADYTRLTDLNETVYGRMEYISENAVGTNFNYVWPYVKLTADGDLALKGDEWQVMNFNFEVLKLDSVTPRQIIIPHT